MSEPLPFNMPVTIRAMDGVPVPYSEIVDADGKVIASCRDAFAAHVLAAINHTYSNWGAEVEI